MVFNINVIHLNLHLKEVLQHYPFCIQIAHRSTKLILPPLYLVPLSIPLYSTKTLQTFLYPAQRYVIFNFDKSFAIRPLFF